MNNAMLQHTIFMAIITIIMGFICDPAIGYSCASSFFLGREVAQIHAGIAGSRTRNLRELPKALWVKRMTLVKEWFIPSVACLPLVVVL